MNRVLIIPILQTCSGYQYEGVNENANRRTGTVDKIQCDYLLARVCGNRRMNPALSRGKAAPSRIDWGSINKTPSDHFTPWTNQVESIPEIILSKANSLGRYE